MKTKHEIKYNRGPELPPVIIPQGTQVYSAASDCGPRCYWVTVWPGMSAEELQYEKKRGYLISSMEVEE